jgi:hypothetical protein
MSESFLCLLTILTLPADHKTQSDEYSHLLDQAELEELIHVVIDPVRWSEAFAVVFHDKDSEFRWKGIDLCTPVNLSRMTKGDKLRQDYFLDRPVLRVTIRARNDRGLRASCAGRTANEQ